MYFGLLGVIGSRPLLSRSTKIVNLEVTVNFSCMVGIAKICQNMSFFSKNSIIQLHIYKPLSSSRPHSST